VSLSQVVEQKQMQIFEYRMSHEEEQLTTQYEGVVEAGTEVAYVQ